MHKNYINIHIKNKQQMIYSPSQINDLQSSHDTCTRVAAEGVAPVDETIAVEVEGQG